MTATVIGPRSRWSAAGGISSQLSQALASFLLSAAALRTLAPSQFGVLALLLGLLVLATGLMTGFIGDSLTVLDRSRAPLRAGLQVWCLLIAVVLAVVGIAGTAPGLLSVGNAVLFGLGLAAFVLEDTLRRLLMACLRFWWVVVVDVAYLVSAAVLLVGVRVASGRLVLADFLLALLVGQVVASVVAVLLLPRDERRLVSVRHPALREIAAFGGWRAAQQALRPGSLSLVRVVVVAAAGQAALGQLEAARLYLSPALLVVQGSGGYLLAVYARNRTRDHDAALRSAARAAMALTAASLVLGLLATAALPVVGEAFTGGSVQVSWVAALGWGVFAASVAATLPYASLTAVRGRPGVVLALRLADTVLAVALVLLLVLALDVSPSVAPFALAVGGLLGAVLQRRVAIRATSRG